MRLTRRSFLGGAAGPAVAGAGIYELVDQLTAAPHRTPATSLPPEQHVFHLGSVQSEGVEVLVPPLHSEIVTARIATSDLRANSAIWSRRSSASTTSTRRTRPGSASRSHGGCRTSSSVWPRRQRRIC